MYQTERFTEVIGNFDTRQNRVAYWQQAGRVAELKALNAQGLSASQIAKQMGGITRNAVIGKLHRLGITNGARAMRTYLPRTTQPVRAKHKGGKGNFNTELRQLRAPKLNGGPLPPEPPRPAKLFALANMEDHQCRFPYGDPKSGEFGFCGCKKMAGSSYCPGHHGKVWQGVPVRTRAPTGTLGNPTPARRAGRTTGACVV